MMKYYKDGSGGVFGYEDGRDTPEGMTELTPAELALLLSPPSAPVDYEAQISGLYVGAMRNLSRNYTREEIDTFHRKSVAATAYAAGTATDAHIYYLAKIDGVVNGASPLTDDEKVLEVAGIDAVGITKIEERVAKILVAESQFDFYSAKIEQLRNTHLDLLVDSGDNQAVVDSLAAAYAAAS